MEQRPLRLGDLVDDYCPRERRITNHTIVAIVNQTIRQTRCTTCESEHVFKAAKVPRRRTKDSDADDQPVDNTGGQLVAPRVGDVEAEVVVVEQQEVVEVIVESVADDVTDSAAAPDANDGRPDDVWPANRPLIRATLPRSENDAPPPRPIPEFTMHQRHNGRGGGGFRQGRG